MMDAEDLHGPAAVEPSAQLEEQTGAGMRNTLTYSPPFASWLSTFDSYHVVVTLHNKEGYHH